jgi:hypothetical protein
MYAAHTLLKAIGVPRYVVVEQDITDLKVDTFPCRLGGHQHLDRTITKLLFRVEPRAGVVAGTRLHAAMDAADLEAPGLQLFNEIVESVPKLSEQEKALVRMVEETLTVEQTLELRELGLGIGGFHGLGLLGELTQFRDLLAHLLGVPGQGYGLEHLLEPLTLVLLHFFDLFRIGEVWRGQSGEFLGFL